MKTFLKHKNAPTIIAISCIVLIAIIVAVIVAVVSPRHSDNSVAAPTLAMPGAVSTAPLPKAVLVATDSPTDPVSITINGQTAKVVGISAKTSGILDPPEDVSLIGWNVHSSQPGKPGTTLMTGHSDNWDKLGSAHSWSDLHKGDTITVKGRKNTQWTYKVSRIIHVKKNDKFPKHLVNTTTGRNKLVLVTCTGRIVGSALGHEDNIFVIARLVGSRKMPQ